MRYLPVMLVGFALACTKDPQPPPAAAGAAVDHRAADEATIRGLDSAWVKASIAKNVDAAVAVYADSASMFAPAAPMATGKATIHGVWAGLLALPAASLTFAPDRIDVSGDRAIDIGSYTLTYNDNAGKPQTSKARYVVVWGRQADGTWKVLVDVPTTTK
jgi:ketosteroid isomerase-like protein